MHPQVSFQPRLGLRADISSGDSDPHRATLQTSNALFPIGNYFSVFNDTGPGPANVRDLHPSVRLRLATRVRIVADWLVWWRQSVQDGLYGVSGDLLAAGKNSARFVRRRPGIEVVWQIDRHAYVQLDYGVFFAGKSCGRSEGPTTSIAHQSWSVIDSSWPGSLPLRQPSSPSLRPRQEQA